MLTFIYIRPALCFIFVYNCCLTVRNKWICYVMLCYVLSVPYEVRRCDATLDCAHDQSTRGLTGLTCSVSSVQFVRCEQGLMLTGVYYLVASHHQQLQLQLNATICHRYVWPSSASTRQQPWGIPGKLFQNVRIVREDWQSYVFDSMIYSNIKPKIVMPTHDGISAMRNWLSYCF